MQLIDLGHRADVAWVGARHLDMLLALQHEQVVDLEGFAAVADVQQAALRHRALVHAEDAELADKGVGGDLEDMRQHMLARVGLGMHQRRVGAFAVQEIRRVAFGRVGQQLDDHVQQLGHAGTGLGRDEAHRDQVAFAQRLLQRRMQLGRVDVAVVQVAVDEVGIDLDHLLDQRAVGGIDRAEVGMAFAVVEAVHHLRTPGIRQVQRQALLAEGGLDLRQQPGQVHPRRVDLVDDDHAVELALRGVLHHAHGHRLDAVDGADDDGRGFHRLQRRQRLADEVRRTRRVDEMHARAGMLQVHHGRVQRMLHAPFQRIEVADGAAAVQRARRGDRAGLQQQRFGQAGLAGCRRSDQGQGANAGDGIGGGAVALTVESGAGHELVSLIVEALQARRGRAGGWPPLYKEPDSSPIVRPEADKPANGRRAFVSASLQEGRRS